MNGQEILDYILRSYRNYYDVNCETPVSPFAAEAVFHSHDEQFFLIKSATISEAESNEYVFFALCDRLDTPTLHKLDEAAWVHGTSRVKPHKDHRNTDITLVIIADSIEEAAIPLIRKLHHYKSYRFGLMGWTNYRIIALDSSFVLTCNRQGKTQKRLFQNIIKKIREKKEREG